MDSDVISWQGRQIVQSHLDLDDSLPLFASPEPRLLDTTSPIRLRTSIRPTVEVVAEDIQDVTAFPIREAALEQIQPIVELLEHSDPTEAHRADPLPDLNIDPARREDRFRVTPLTRDTGLVRHAYHLHRTLSIRL